MSFDPSSTTDAWRAIILFGLNTATYKVALGHALHALVKQGKTTATMHELATVFFDLYNQRLDNGMPQLVNTDRLTVMERVVGRFKGGAIDRTEAIATVEREAFDDVIPRFHVVNNQPLPVKFYETTGSGLVLTDAVHGVLGGLDGAILLDELGARWGLIEAAFAMRRGDVRLVNDIRSFYLASGHERRNVAHLRPALNGYQNGACFYCSESMGSDVHVDHVIPRQVINHDQVWNLVLAHSFCNEQKSDALPSPKYVSRLVERNEYFIASNHPLKNRLIRELGNTPDTRRARVMETYQDACVVIRHTWEGIRGYDPEHDQFYKSFVRSLVR